HCTQIPKRCPDEFRHGNPQDNSAGENERGGAPSYCIELVSNLMEVPRRLEEFVDRAKNKADETSSRVPQPVGDRRLGKWMTLADREANNMPHGDPSRSMSETVRHFTPCYKACSRAIDLA